MSTVHVSKNNTESSSKMTLKSHKLLAGALSLVLVAGMLSPAFALTVDDFTSGANDLTATDGSTTDSNTNTSLPASETIGEARYVQVDGVFPEGAGSDVMARSNPPAGVMSFSSDPDSIGTFYLKWDADGAGLGGVDLTQDGGDRFLVKLQHADQNSDVKMVVMDQSAGSSEHTIMTGAGEQTLEFKFSDFSAGADFTDVDKIELTVFGIDSGDYRIDYIDIPQRKVGGMVGSMDSATLMVAGAQSSMGLWGLALVGVVAIGAGITYKVKSKKSEQ